MVGPFSTRVFDLRHGRTMFPGRPGPPRAAPGYPMQRTRTHRGEFRTGDDAAAPGECRLQVEPETPEPGRRHPCQANRGKSCRALPRSTAARFGLLRNPGAPRLLIESRVIVSGA